MAPAPVRRALSLLPCTTFRCEKQHRASDLMQQTMTRTCSSLHCSKEMLSHLIMLDLTTVKLLDMAQTMWEWISTKLMKMNIIKVTVMNLRTSEKNSSEILKCSLTPMKVTKTSQLLRFKKVPFTKSATLISRAS